ncbi:MAG: Error-prone repair homolog of DNA polymerase III alpha subunit, partial [uncultured Solirubrobacteraceae bacterium]
AVRRAPRPLRLLLPGRLVAAGRAGGRRGGPGLRGDGA